VLCRIEAVALREESLCTRLGDACVGGRLVNNPASRMAGGLAASSQPARLYTKQGSSQPAEHPKPDGLIGLIV
jgi:hypothetical protein